MRGLLLAAVAVGGASAQVSGPAANDLQRDLAAARMQLDVRDGAFSGPGWSLILERAAKARFIAVGEDHLTREVPAFVGALCEAVAPQGLAAMAVEAGPEATEVVQAGLRAPDRAARMAAFTARYPDAIAFLDIDAENALAARCAKASANPSFQLWGLDQEFFGAGGWLLDRILKEPLSPKARAAVTALRAEEAADAAKAEASGDPSKLFIFSASDQGWRRPTS